METTLTTTPLLETTIPMEETMPEIVCIPHESSPTTDPNDPAFIGICEDPRIQNHRGVEFQTLTQALYRMDVVVNVRDVIDNTVRRQLVSLHCSPNDSRESVLEDFMEDPARIPVMIPGTHIVRFFDRDAVLSYDVYEEGSCFFTSYFAVEA